MASNPVFNRIDQDAKKGYAGFGAPGRAQQSAASPASTDQLTPQQLQEMYYQPSATPVQAGRVTLDDVVMKTLSLFAIVLVFAAGGWLLADANPDLGFALMLGSIVLTLGLGFAIALKKTISVPLILIYAVVEGVLVGAVSNFYNDQFGKGIVGQAVLATLCVFAAMLAAYKFKLVRVTDKFRRIMTFAIGGYLIFALVNLGYSLFTSTPFGIGGTGMLGIGISLFAVGLASFTLALDFDSIDRAITSGAPQKYSWLLAHGLIVTLVWLYLELLRLLGRLRSN